MAVRFRVQVQIRSECLTCTFRARLSWAQVPAFTGSSVHDRKIYSVTDRVGMVFRVRMWFPLSIQWWSADRWKSFQILDIYMHNIIYIYLKQVPLSPSRLVVLWTGKWINNIILVWQNLPCLILRKLLVFFSFSYNKYISKVNTFNQRFLSFYQIPFR